jgi:hypothetical protein
MYDKIREEVRSAVLAGMMDAWCEVMAGQADHHAAAEAFRARMALPGPANGHGGGLDLLAEAKAAGIDLPAGNGHDTSNRRGRNKRPAE